MPLPLPAPRPALALAILRIVTGIVFVGHGCQKLFVNGIGGVSAFFTQLGVPLAGVAAPAVSVLEFAGGLALIAGLFSRPIALLLALDVGGALIFAHAGNGFFVPLGIEFVLTLATAALAIFLAGPGSFAADDLLFKKKG